MASVLGEFWARITGKQPTVDARTAAVLAACPDLCAPKPAPAASAPVDAKAKEDTSKLQGDEFRTRNHKAPVKLFDEAAAKIEMDAIFAKGTQGTEAPKAKTVAATKKTAAEELAQAERDLKSMAAISVNTSLLPASERANATQNLQTATQRYIDLRIAAYPNTAAKAAKDAELLIADSKRAVEKIQAQAVATQASKLPQTPEVAASVQVASLPTKAPKLIVTSSIQVQVVQLKETAGSIAAAHPNLVEEAANAIGGKVDKTTKNLTVALAFAHVNPKAFSPSLDDVKADTELRVPTAQEVRDTVKLLKSGILSDNRIDYKAEVQYKPVEEILAPQTPILAAARTAHK